MICMLMNYQKKRQCLSKTLVGGNPGKDKLIQCSDGKIEKIKKENGKVFRKANTYKYTNNLRIETTKSDEYQIIREHERNNRGIIIRDRNSPFNEGRAEKIVTVSEIELLLSAKNSSSCVWEKALD